MNESLKTSQAGLGLITKWEGCVLHAYTCVAGKLTIGIGHVILPGEKFPAQITPTDATNLLRKDVERFEKGVYKNITVQLNQNQFDALVCFTFNVGEGGLVGTGVQKAINAGQFDQVPAKLEEWSKARVNGVLKILTGLLNRRKSEAALFMKPVGDTAPDDVFVPWTKQGLTLAQSKLQQLGLYLIQIDGLCGPSTERAIKTFAAQANISVGPDPKKGVLSSFLGVLAKA